MKEGDLVMKLGHSDRGQVGIVLSILKNDLGNELLTVLTQEGRVRIWYKPNVNVVQKSCK